MKPQTLAVSRRPYFRRLSGSAAVWITAQLWRCVGHATLTGQQQQQQQREVGALPGTMVRRPLTEERLVWCWRRRPASFADFLPSGPRWDTSGLSLFLSVLVSGVVVCFLVYYLTSLACQRNAWKYPGDDRSASRASKPRGSLRSVLEVHGSLA